MGSVGEMGNVLPGDGKEGESLRKARGSQVEVNQFTALAGDFIG